MKPGNPLSQLIIDYWYKAMLVICFVLFVVSLTQDVHVITNAALMLLSSGGMFVSIGEWINHPLQTRIARAPYGFSHISSYRRLPSILGNLFDILGLILICLGFLHIYRAL